MNIPSDDRSQPIDLDHLARQTCDDRSLQREVLLLFAEQLDGALAALPEAQLQQRWQVAHGLKGAAAGVGAFAVAACAESIQRTPQDEALVARLHEAAEEVRSFLQTVLS